MEELVKYTDADNNGFLDTVEYDYEGARKIDFRVSLLDYRSANEPHPDVATIVNTHKEGWQGLHALFTRIANQSFQEGLTVYRAAWRRGLTTPEIDKLASASSVGERYDHGFWLKEKVFRQLRARLQEARQSEPAQAQSLMRSRKSSLGFITWESLSHTRSALPTCPENDESAYGISGGTELGYGRKARRMSERLH